MLRLIFLLAALIAAPLAAAPNFPPLTGRVVDSAHVLAPDRAAALAAKLEALEASSGRQLVVATVPDLEGLDIQDYGVQLGNAWAIGDRERDDGAILLVAPNERKVGIQVGYGLESVLTDALSGVIIRRAILPAFRAGDLPGGIEAGADAIVEQLSLPPEEAQARLAAAAADQRERRSAVSPEAIFWGFILLTVIVPMFLNRITGRRHRGGRAPVVIWGPGLGGGGWGGGSSGGFGGGGFSGGGGSFGGGGASGGW